MSHKDLNYLSDMLNLEMDKLLIWFKANKLSLNLKKTTFTVFKPRQKDSICNIQISIDNQNIVKLKETNFLGVIQMSLRMLYYSLIYPYFYYCNIVWASTYKIHNLHHLVILQKRIIRIINKSHFNAHTDNIFKDLGILEFNDIHLLQLGQFMYSCKNYLQGFIRISLKAINSTLTIQEIPRPTVYRIVVQTLRNSRPFSRA